MGRGVDVTLYCTSVERKTQGLPNAIVETLAVAGHRVPHRAIGVDRAYRYHDWRVARELSQRGDEFDVVHTWPLGSARTLATASDRGVVGLRESPNSYTAVAYGRAENEAERLGLAIPRGASHRFDARRLAREEAEYDLATAILVPSESVQRTYEQRPGNPVRTIRHSYGFDPDEFPAPPPHRASSEGLVVVFLGRCEPRKGLHYALEGWHQSGVRNDGGRLIVCGEWESAYRDALAHQLDDPSIEVRPFTTDAGALLRSADILVLPSVEEGSALVTYEAQASGCALLVSDAAGAYLTDGEHGFVHAAGDVGALAHDLQRLGDDRALLARIRSNVLSRRDDLSWAAAAERLEAAYRAAMAVA